MYLDFPVFSLLTYLLQSIHKSVSQTFQLPVSKSIYYSFSPSLLLVVYLYCTSMRVERLRGENPGNPFRLFHATFGFFFKFNVYNSVYLLNKPEIRNRIALWNIFHTKCILLSLSHKKSCVLGWNEYEFQVTYLHHSTPRLVC